MSQRHTLSILVKNKPGVLTKIAQMFYRRGYNIESLTVGKTQVKNISKIVLWVPLDQRDVEYLRRRIANLEDVCQASILRDQGVLLMEVCLVRVAFDCQQQCMELMKAAQSYSPQVLAVENNSITLVVSAAPSVIDAFVKTLSHYSIQDVSRTGMTALETENERQTQNMSTAPIDQKPVEFDAILQGGRP